MQIILRIRQRYGNLDEGSVIGCTWSVHSCVGGRFDANALLISPMC